MRHGIETFGRLVILLAVPLLGGCETLAYLAQAARGQLALVGSARPLERVLADPNTPPELKARLANAAAIRDYASRHLQLPDNGSYRSYVELGRPYPVWNVVAAGEFSVHPLRSCFPISGCVNYRGFFSREQADRYADNLRDRGDDVIVYGVPAYSTLGYFDDPLLSSFIRYPDTELARLLFHELAHQVVYVKEDSSFNESFAVALEREAVRRWLSSQGKQQELASFRQASARAESFKALLDKARDRLSELYRQSPAPADPAALRAAKAREFAQLKSDYEKLKTRWNGFTGYDRLIVDQPNNALLAAFNTYTRLVPAFEKMLPAKGASLEEFYAKVRALAAEAPEVREEKLKRLLN